MFQLGEVLHFQAGVDAENHAPLRLFVDSCVATPAPERGSSPQYAFIDFSGYELAVPRVGTPFLLDFGKEKPPALPFCLGAWWMGSWTMPPRLLYPRGPVQTCSSSQWRRSSSQQTPAAW